MMLLIINSAVIILTKLHGAAVDLALIVLKTVFFFLCVFFCELWASLCTGRSGRRVARRGFFVMSIPLFIMAAFLLYNLTDRMVFSIATGNRYERGPLFHVMSAIGLFYVGYSYLMSWRSKKIADV